MSVPLVGSDVGPNNDWLVELAWPEQRVAVVIDEDPQRDAWLSGEQWTVIDATLGYDVSIVSEALIQSVSSS